MQDKETKKTVIYLLAAAAALVVAWEPWRRTAASTSQPSQVGKKLFEEFDDPLKAKSLDILKFDETNATIHQFKVAQANGVWSIPSHSNYPADAKEHMAEAATALLNLEILNVASTSPGDHELYGVISPDPQKLRPGMVGVGMEVRMKDDKDNTLADLIIGKEVKDQPELRYVRREGRDPVYKVKIRTDKLSTKFEDWIEKDLLKLNAFDVRSVELNDYSTQEGMKADGSIALGINQRSRAKLNYDDAHSSWNLEELATFDSEGKPVTAKLPEDEELNAEKLNNMKTALDDLLIVDVERKPAGLSQDLRASDDFMQNREAIESLLDRGFYPAARPGGPREIFSSEGEAACTTKDGVKYVLRFGGLAATDPTASEDKEKKSSAPNRYLFVMAQFDQDQIPEPQLQPVPGEDKEKSEADVEKPADAEKSGEEKSAEEKSVEEKVETPPTTPEEEERIAIRRENKRRQMEYDDQVKRGKEKVKELNDRFADWYFIISEDVYKKIHLGQTDFAKKKNAKEDPDSGLPTSELRDLGRGIQGD